jgi:hypothetical protein
MAGKKAATWLIDEVAGFLASCPSREELLAYRPSSQLQERFRSLLSKAKIGSLNAEEEWELSQFRDIEMLMASIKARLNTR